MNMSNVAFCLKPTNKLRLRSIFNASSTRTDTCLLDKKASTNLLKPVFYLDKWPTASNTEKCLNFAPAAKEPPRIEGMVLLHDRLSDICVRIWFSIVQNLTFNMLLATLSIYLFILGLLSAQRKVVSWHSHSVAVLLATEPDLDIWLCASHVATHFRKPSSHNSASAHPVHIPRQTRYSYRRAITAS